MRDRKIAIKAVHDALRATRRVEGLLETFTGEALARLYEEQKKPSGPSVPKEREYIVGAQPMIHPGLFDARLMIDPKGIKQPIPITDKDWEQFYVSSVMVGWWYIRTVALFDEDMLNELLETDQKDLYVNYSHYQRFLGNPVFIPFEKPYISDDKEIFGCIFGVFGLKDGEYLDKVEGMRQWYVFLLPLCRDRHTGIPHFLAVNLSTIYFEASDIPVKFLSLVEDALTNWNDPTGIGLCAHELFSKVAYLLTEAPEVKRCMSVSAPTIKRPRKKPETIFPAECPRFMLLGEEFGNLIREYRNREVTSGHTVHGTVRPHIRRAHWHTYLTGTGRENRVIKWVLPILVKSADLSKD
ncbi:hypothetical protein [Parasutterella excrementihominis]